MKAYFWLSAFLAGAAAILTGTGVFILAGPGWTFVYSGLISFWFAVLIARESARG